MDRMIISTKLFLDIANAIKKFPVKGDERMDQVCIYRIDDSDHVGAVYTDGRVMIKGEESEKKLYPNFQDAFMDEQYLFSFTPEDMMNALSGIDKKESVTLTWSENACTVTSKGKSASFPIVFDEKNVPETGTVSFLAGHLVGLLGTPSLSRNNHLKCIFSRSVIEGNEQSEDIPYYLTFGKRNFVLMPCN